MKNKYHIIRGKTKDDKNFKRYMRKTTFDGVVTYHQYTSRTKTIPTRYGRYGHKTPGLSATTHNVGKEEFDMVTIDERFAATEVYEPHVMFGFTSLNPNRIGK